MLVALAVAAQDRLVLAMARQARQIPVAVAAGHTLQTEVRVSVARAAPGL
jgi:hypothetical protein